MFFHFWLQCSAGKSCSADNRPEHFPVASASQKWVLCPMGMSCIVWSRGRFVFLYYPTHTVSPDLPAHYAVLYQPSSLFSPLQLFSFPLPLSLNALILCSNSFIIMLSTKESRTSVFQASLEIHPLSAWQCSYLSFVQFLLSFIFWLLLSYP